jgi:hypothetical protein
VVAALAQSVVMPQLTQPEMEEMVLFPQLLLLL